MAQLLGLKIAKNRAYCPACDSDRAIQLFPETNSFRCYGIEKSGDCIALYAHVKGYKGMYRAAAELQEHFSCTPPQKTEGGTAKAQPAPPKRAEKREEQPFDPQAFAAKLAFTEEVEALGFDEETAERFCVGYYRGRVYIPVRDEDGSIAGFIGYTEGELKLPPRWLPRSNVVALKRA